MMIKNNLDLLLCAIEDSDTSSTSSNDPLISYGRITQRSYGSEKRFISPPPSIQLHEKTLVRCEVISDGIVTSAQSVYGDYILFKQLYTSSKSCYLRFSFNQTTIYSQPIRVISKPTKTAKINALAIRSGDSIALFSRVNSQTVRTRYISTAGADMNRWSVLSIESEKEYVEYGAKVKLRVGADTIEATLRNPADLESKGVVSHLNKVVFEKDGGYLGVCDDTVFYEVTGKVKTKRLDFFSRPLDDLLVWTICGVTSD